MMSEKSKTSGATIFSLKNLAALLIIAAVGVYFFAFDYVKSMYLNHVPRGAQEEFVEIPTGSNFEEVVAILTKQGVVFLSRLMF